MKQIDLIGKSISVDEAIDDDELEKAILIVREEFNGVARYAYWYKHADCGAIRWTWLTTLWRLEVQQLQKEEGDMDLSKTEFYNICIRMYNLKWNFRIRCAPFMEYFYRKAAKKISERVYALEHAGVSEDESVRQIAIDLALKLDGNRIYIRYTSWI